MVVCGGDNSGDGGGGCNDGIGESDSDDGSDDGGDGNYNDGGGEGDNDGGGNGDDDSGGDLKRVFEAWTTQPQELRGLNATRPRTICRHRSIRRPCVCVRERE